MPRRAPSGTGLSDPVRSRDGVQPLPSHPRAQTCETVTGKPKRCIHGFILAGNPPARCPLCRADEEQEERDARVWWTNQRSYALTKLYERGLTAEEIAVRLGTTPKAVTSKLERMKVHRILEEQR